LTLGNRVERRLLFTADVVAFGRRDERRQEAVLAALPKLMDGAAQNAGLMRPAWCTQTTGDGELAILPPDESEPQLVDDFVRELAAALALYNDDRVEGARIRLRLAVHHGTAKQQGKAFAGQGVIVVCRLVSSAPLRAVMERSTAQVALIVSGRVFNDTIRQRRTSLRAGDFRAVTVQEKDVVETAWIRAVGADVHSIDLTDAASPDAVSPDGVSADAVSPDGVSADAVSPDAVSPDAVSPDAVSADDDVAGDGSMRDDTTKRGRRTVDADAERGSRPNVDQPQQSVRQDFGSVTTHGPTVFGVGIANS
jgi:hypothetical protein